MSPQQPHLHPAHFFRWPGGSFRLHLPLPQTAGYGHHFFIAAGDQDKHGIKGLRWSFCEAAWCQALTDPLVKGGLGLEGGLADNAVGVTVVAAQSL